MVLETHSLLFVVKLLLSHYGSVSYQIWSVFVREAGLRREMPATCVIMTLEGVVGLKASRSDQRSP